MTKNLLLLLVAFLLANVAGADTVFNSPQYDLSFRYPDQWSERKPQLHTTVVLLYADDGSEATCNITAGTQSEKLIEMPEAKLNELRRKNHTEEHFVNRLNDQAGFEAKSYWRGKLGQKDAGFLEFENDLYVDDKAVRFRTLIGSTLANERRITLLCNGPVRQRSTIKSAFDYIRNTLIFRH